MARKLPNKKTSRGRRDKRDDVRKEKDFDETRSSRINDVSWYANSPALLKDAASFPYSRPAGVPFSLGTFDLSPDVSPEKVSTRFPGILVYNIDTAPGIANHESDAVNVSAKNLYSFVRHQNSGHANYDAPDLMLYILGVKEALSWYATLVRVYGLLDLYTPLNRYVPEGLVSALGFDFADLISQMADFRYIINYFGARLNAMVIPVDMPIIQRHIWMFSGIYADGTSQKAQLFAYKMAGYRTFVETGAEAKYGGKLKYHLLPSTPIKLAKIREICDEIMDPLIASEDMNIMSGDILKAFGSSVLNISSITEQFSVQPVYSEEVLSQFQNAISLPHVADGGTLDIAQDPTTGVLKFTPTFTIPSKNPSDMAAPMLASSIDRILTLYIDNPEPAHTMVASRLMYGAECDKKTQKFTVTTMGTEIVRNMDMWMFERSQKGRLSLNNYNLQSFNAFVIDNNESADTNWSRIFNYAFTTNALTAFKFFPTMYEVFINNSPTGVNSRSTVKCAVDNFTTLNTSDIEAMNEVAVLSEFNSPSMGRMALLANS